MRACNNCGKCCTSPSFMGSLSVTERDIRRWERERRTDILEFVHGADVWITEGGHEMSTCPFVRREEPSDRWFCTIYSTRPEVCRNYPQSISQMDVVGCEMLEPGDEQLSDREFAKAIKGKFSSKLEKGKLEGNDDGE